MQIWHNKYPLNIPTSIDPDRYKSIIDILDEAVEKFQNRDAYICMNKALSFIEVDRLSSIFATYLKRIGLQVGDRIAIQMPNVLQYPIAVFGALKAGLIVVNTNPIYTPSEMEYQFKDSGAKAIVILENFAFNLDRIIARTSIEHVIIAKMGDMFNPLKGLLINFVLKKIKKMIPAYQLSKYTFFKEALHMGSKAKYQKTNLKNTDTAFLQYTGGTTGVSKGAILTHRNIIANVEACNEWFKPVSDQDTDKIILAALPFYHIFGLTVNILLATKLGLSNIMIPNPRDLKSFTKEYKKYPISMFPGVNTMFKALLHYDPFRTVDFSKLRLVLAGGMALQAQVAEDWKALTGTTISEGYGLSETSPVLSCNPLNGTQRVNSIGLPISSTDMAILLDNQQWGDIDEVGEICAKGPQVTQGYYKRDKESASSFFKDKDGALWFKTGDIGKMDKDGFFYIVDRKKDMILVSGFNVYPNEIEDVVAKCPGVFEVACIGVPDEKSSEVVKIFVVKKDPKLTEEDILKHCHQYLTRYKIPKYIEFRKDLPKTNVGKILRRSLRDEELKKATK